MGRHRINIDPERVARLAERGLYQWQIAQALGISISTLDRRIKDDPAVERAIREHRSEVLTEMMDCVLDKARKGSLQAQMFLVRMFLKKHEQLHVDHWDECLNYDLLPPWVKPERKTVTLCETDDNGKEIPGTDKTMFEDELYAEQMAAFEAGEDPLLLG